MPVILTNKKAKFDYTVLESFQAGLALSPRMVKLIRRKKVVLEGKYIIPQHGALMILDFGNEELRENITLLLNKKEISEITHQLKQNGISCIPLNIKSVGRWIKSEVALVKGKKTKDKRQTIKDRDLDREMGRNIASDFS